MRPRLALLAALLSAAASGSSLAQPIGTASGSGLSGLGARSTWSGQVAKIVQRSCQSCHRAGDIAPFPLETYAQAYEYRDLIRHQVTTREMPPWKAAHGCGDFQDDRSLAEAEIATIARWVDAGAPEGDPARTPPNPDLPLEWKAGTPDLELQMAVSYTPDFSRGDEYRCFVMPVGNTEDRFLSAVEVLPGNRAMVHHVLLFNDVQGQSEELDRADPKPGYACFGGPGFDPAAGGLANALSMGLGGWAPGNQPMVLPDGVGISLPRGSRVVMQVHYSSAGSGHRPSLAPDSTWHSGLTARGWAPPAPRHEESDQTRVGFHYARSAVQKRYLNLPVVNRAFTIPAGASRHEVRASIPLVPLGVHVLGVTPHMHLLGREMRVSVTPLGGAEICLVNVPDWDFHWQGTYYYRDPIAVPFGSRVDLVARYDNSTGNPANPSSPPKDVSWGEATTDEMCLAFLGFTIDSEDLSRSSEDPLLGVPKFWEDPWPR